MRFRRLVKEDIKASSPNPFADDNYVTVYVRLNRDEVLLNPDMERQIANVRMTHEIDTAIEKIIVDSAVET